MHARWESQCVSCLISGSVFCLFSRSDNYLDVVIYRQSKMAEFEVGEKISFARPWSDDVSVNKGRKYISSLRHNAKIVHSTTQCVLITQGRQNIVKTLKDEMEEERRSFQLPLPFLIFFYFLFFFSSSSLTCNMFLRNRRDTPQKSEFEKEV